MSEDKKNTVGTIPKENQLVKIFSFRIGVVVFFDVGDIHNNFEEKFNTSINHVVNKLSTYNSYSRKLDISSTDTLVDPESEFDPEDATVVNNVNTKVAWLDYKDEGISEKHDALAIVCYRGLNNNEENAYVFCSVRLQQLNRSFALAKRGDLHHFAFGRVIESGIGPLNDDVLNNMFDNWLYSERKLIVKYINRKAGAQ